MAWTNYHSHTKYCDGNSTPELYIKNALKLELLAYGFSAHAPVNFKTDWCIPDSDFEDYLKEIRHLKKKYKSEIQTYLGLEIDYIPGIAGRSKHLQANCEIDYFIGSIHFIDKFADGTHWNIDHTKEFFDKGIKEIFDGNFEKASDRFYELTRQMITEDQPDVIGHLDKIKMYNEDSVYFSETEKWYKKQVENTLAEIKKAGTIVEINTRGYYKYGQKDLYPSAWIIKKMVDMDIPMMLNSDAHAPNEVIAGFEYAVGELKKMGVKYLWSFYNNKWQALEFNNNGFISNFS